MPLCVQIDNMVKAEIWENWEPHAQLYSQRNCEINHCVSSLMRVHLVKAQENNYLSLLYPIKVSEGSANTAAEVWNSPSTACSLSRHSNLARKAT